MSENNQAHVTDYGDAFLSLLIEGASGGLDGGQSNVLGPLDDNFRESHVPPELQPEDVAEMIRSRLEGIQSGSHKVVFDSGYEWTDEISHSRARASSTVSSDARALEEDLMRGWQPVGEATWEVPAAQRRATFDQSDFSRYRQRPAWKCKHCEGVGWAEEDPCDGCGRYLPENYVPQARRQAREGDWLCGCCGNTNWEWRMQCNRCHSCRSDPLSAPQVAPPEAPVEEIVKQRLRKRLSTHPAGVFKDNDWVCVSCGNINWDWRVKCHQCASAKPFAKTRSVHLSS